MKVADLSLREKVLQTVALRHKNDRIITEQPGAVFFGGEIITEAEDIGLEAARQTLAQYFDNSPVPPLLPTNWFFGLSFK